MKIVLASRNKKKIAEMLTLLKEQGGPLAEISVLSLDDIGVTDEIEENGTTFEENARIKAEAGAKMGYITIADDSGLCVDALNGEPGVRSARFSGGGDAENNALLTEKLSGLPTEKRTARFAVLFACSFLHIALKNQYKICALLGSFNTLALSPWTVNCASLYVLCGMK